VLAATEWDVSVLIQIAGRTETDWLEWKAASGPGTWPRKDWNSDDFRWHIAEAVVALANTHGGCVLVGVDDDGNAVGLDASDPRGIRATQGSEAFRRYFFDTVLSRKAGWKREKTGFICIEGGMPGDSAELHPATLDGKEILAILVRPRFAGATCLHCLEGLQEKRSSFVLKRTLGSVGQVERLVGSRVGEWERHRQPEQPNYAEMLAHFQASRATPSTTGAPAGIENRIAAYRAGLRQLLEEVERCFVSLDAEECIELDIGDEAFQPWAEEYLREDAEWDEEESEESEDHDPLAPSERRVARSGGVFALLSQEPRAVLLGEPGAGKSTCLKRLALRVSTGGEQGGCVALFVPLSRYRCADDMMPLLVRAAVVSREPGGRLSEADLGYLARADRLLLLLDAFNECPEAHQNACALEIAKLLSRYPSLPFVLSARTLGWRHLVGAPAFTVQPLDSVRQRGLLTNFLGDDARASEVHDRLLALPGGAATASNPLILRMAVEVFRTDGALPAGRASLYRRFVGLWYAREAAKAQKSGAPLAWSKTLVRQALSRLAWAARCEGRRVISRARAEELLTSEVEAPGAFLERLGQGFLLRSTGEEVDFVHESFQEYFAAEHCAAAPEVSAGWQREHYGDWSLVLAYAAELSETLPAPLLAAAWRMNPWLGSVLAPHESPLPSDFAVLTEHWKPDAVACLLSFFAGVPPSGISTFAGPGWYFQGDAALRYAIARDAASLTSWMEMEAGLLRGAWHPAQAESVLRRAFGNPAELMRKAWPPRRGQRQEGHRFFPKSWLKARARTAARLIALGVLQPEDFTSRKAELIAIASPKQARYWIESGVLLPSDFASRRAEFIAGPSIKQMDDLIAGGICTPSDFSDPEERAARANPLAAAQLVLSGICKPEHFIRQRADWITSASANEAIHLVAAGICVASDFTNRRQGLAALAKPAEQRRLVTAGICTEDDLRAVPLPEDI
jgi:hypothetical protein